MLSDQERENIATIRRHCNGGHTNPSAPPYGIANLGECCHFLLDMVERLEATVETLRVEVLRLRAELILIKDPLGIGEQL